MERSRSFWPMEHRVILASQCSFPCITFQSTTAQVNLKEQSAFETAPSRYTQVPLIVFGFTSKRTYQPVWVPNHPKLNIAFVRGNGGSRTPMSQTCLLQLGASWSDWRNDGRKKIARVLTKMTSKKYHMLKKNTGCRNHKKMKTYYFTWENTCNQASTALMRFAWWWLTEANTRYRGQEGKSILRELHCAKTKVK